MVPERKKAAKFLVQKQKEILQSIYGNTGYSADWESFILRLPQKKLSGLCQRAQFVYFSYEYIIEYCQKNEIALPNNRLDETKVAHLAVLAELIISCQYYDNYILDGKNGVNTPEQISKYINAKDSLKSVIYQFIKDNFADDDNTVNKVIACTETIFRLVTTGQQMQADYNDYSTFKSGLSSVPDMGTTAESVIDTATLHVVKKTLLEGLSLNDDQEIFFETYLKRVNLISAQLFSQFSLLISDLIGLDENNSIVVTKFAPYFGYVAQFINDNIDTVELRTESKPIQDAFSDLRNKNVTLPTFIHLVQNDDENDIILSILESDFRKKLIFVSQDAGFQGKVYKVLHPDLKAKVRRALQPALVHYAIPAVQRLAKLASSYIDTDLQSGKILLNMLEIAYDNRFYHTISTWQEDMDGQKLVNEANSRPELTSKIYALETKGLSVRFKQFAN